MIDFIIAGIMFLGVMFVVCFCISFVTIGLGYALASFAKSCTGWFRQAQPALK